MSLWRQLTHGARVLFRRDAADRDVSAEVAHYLQESSAAHERRGLSAADALRTAQLEVGSELNVREEVRSAGWEHFISTVITDARYALRRLAKSPGFTALAVTTLALGIGATTAIFSALKPIVLDPVPYAHGDRLATLWYRGVDGAAALQTFGNYRELVARSRAFEEIAAFRSWQPTHTGSGEPERLDGQRVTENYFRTLDATLARGHWFDAADDRPDGADVAIISDALWRRRFGADPSIVGAKATLSDRLFTIIGVLPASFDNVLDARSQIWSLLQFDAASPANGREWGHQLRVIGRVRDGVRIDAAAEEVNRIAATPTPEFSRPTWSSMNAGLIVRPLRDEVAAGVKPALFAVAGAVVLVLLIACVNVTGLLLGRASQRRGEMSMRAALGASRARIGQQLLTECMVLAFVGGVAAIVIAQVGVSSLVALAPPGLPRAGAIALDGGVFVFAFGVAALVGLLIGIGPALNALRGDLQASRHGSARVTGRQRAIRHALAISEVALALVLLVGAGLLLRSLQSVFAIDPGFDASRLLTMQVQTSPQRLDQDAADRFFTQALESVRRVPGISEAGFTNQLPLSGDQDEFGAQFEDDAPSNRSNVFRYAVSPGYIEAIRIPLRSGRTFARSDVAGSAAVALISESLARRKFPAGNAVGRRVHLGREDQPWYEIVGVVGDVKQVSLASDQPEAVYVPASQSPFAQNTLSLVVRARGDAGAMAAAVKSAIWSVDKDQPILRVATMDDIVNRLGAERRFSLVVFEVFALVALALAATGIYGVLATGVAERTREIGVRAALGATQGRVVALVLKQGLLLTGFGLVAGLVVAIAASRSISGLLFGVSHVDFATYAGVVVLTLIVSAAACVVPAWRAARVDPVTVLR